MSTAAHEWATPVDHVVDRIDVTDDEGHRLGYVDASTGERTVLVPESRDVLDEIVDFWMNAAGLTLPDVAPEPAGARRRRDRRDAPTLRTLVIPLVAGS